jgi:AcrR family transcriptional regulator
MSVTATGASGPRSRRRAPTPEQRQVDAERSKAALVDAALEEFAAKGFAGARVRDIAKRAGVSKDLIAYHFGGKEGLLVAVQRAWLARRDAFLDLTLSMPENLARYVHDILSDPRPMRLLAWRGLALGDNEIPQVSEDVYPSAEQLVRRQERGELNPDLDPGTLQLVLIGAVAAPIIFPDAALHLLGMSADDPEFETRYRAGLAKILAALGAAYRPAGLAAGSAGGGSAGGGSR